MADLRIKDWTKTADGAASLNDYDYLAIDGSGASDECRVKDLPNTATTATSTDYVLVDNNADGVRKLLAWDLGPHFNLGSYQALTVTNPGVPNSPLHFGFDDGPVLHGSYPGGGDSNSIDVNLPALDSDNLGRVYYLINTGGSGDGMLMVRAQTGQTLANSTMYNLNQQWSSLIICGVTASRWAILGRYQAV